ncbi:uncharacterized protein DS421_10g299190 [Arachis hypogaea]|nr:uncharacterized protein DS421_10g299190 [Arachis hypogaea]
MAERADRRRAQRWRTTNANFLEIQIQICKRHLSSHLCSSSTERRRIAVR